MRNRQILFIADDFGMSAEVNAAIVDAHSRGALHGACLMMGQPGTSDAIELARRHPSLQIGWHLHLNDSTPCTVAAWPWGRSPARGGLAMAVSGAARALVSNEIDAQWRMLCDTHLRCRFVNTHHHLHWHPFVRAQLVRTVSSDATFDGWLRWGKPCFFGRDGMPLGYSLVENLLQAPARRRLPVRHSSTLWGLDRTFRMDAREVASTVHGLGDGLHEFMFHPRPAPPAGEDPDTGCLIELRERLPGVAPKPAPRPG